ncbi:MAG: hypothetical protein Q7V58_01415 [Actinomycetota bacterium]|nr:hypothetical protein [Actinomycetota bacterium]
MSSTSALEGSWRARGRRPRILDPEVVKRLLEATAALLAPDVVADYAGVGRSTYFGWLSRGREAEEARNDGHEVAASEQPFLDFLDRLTVVRATAEVNALREIEQAAHRGNWRAAAWILERRYPERWGPIGRRRKAESQESAPLVSVAELEAAIERISPAYVV